jgi:hypothetical protein
MKRLIAYLFSLDLWPSCGALDRKERSCIKPWGHGGNHGYGKRGIL